jgi:chitinase
MLIAGDSYAVTNLKKRDGEPEPYTFLDCPVEKLQNRSTTYTARVVCLSDDIEGCFQVTERGVEGTIFEMPDDVSSTLCSRIFAQ